jgi:hypothetical protein
VQHRELLLTGLGFHEALVPHPIGA